MNVLNNNNFAAKQKSVIIIWKQGFVTAYKNYTQLLIVVQ